MDDKMKKMGSLKLKKKAIAKEKKATADIHTSAQIFKNFMYILAEILRCSYCRRLSAYYYYVSVFFAKATNISPCFTSPCTFTAVSK